LKQHVLARTLTPRALPAMATTVRYS